MYIVSVVPPRNSAEDSASERCTNSLFRFSGSTHTRFILSQSLVRNEEYASSLRDWLGDGLKTMLILDEAHNAAPATSSKYAIDSKLTRAIRDLAWRFEHKLFLSATPHNGHSNSFSALLEILDPTRFCRGVPVRNKTDLDPILVILECVA